MALESILLTIRVQKCDAKLINVQLLQKQSVPVMATPVH